MSSHRTAAALLALAAAALGGCSGPEPRAEPREIATLERDQVYVDRTAHVGVVSYLHAGEPGVARVVFVHGAPGDATGWADFLLSVPDGQEYIAPDRPGYGESRPDGAVPSLAAQADALRPFLETDGGAPVVLVGHSLGAAIVAEAALRYPDRVAGLVLVAAALGPDPSGPHWGRRIGAYPPASWVLPRPIDNANRERLAREAELRELVPRLGDIELPVHIVHGARDEQVPYSQVPFMQRRLAGASLHVTRLENAGHFLPWTSFTIVQTQLNMLIATICGGLETCNRGGAAGNGG